jgi:CDP-diacylglycerol--glycerol-3-phosphate 3-phosphatidyltransferase
MTTANKITIVRILLVPLFIVHLLYYVNGGREHHRILAILAFALAAISDGVDGFIARHYNQRSELGAILDPLADKILLVSGVVLLSLNNSPYLERLPFWLATTILSRDLLILIGLAVIHFVCGKVAIRTHLIGKVATVLQMTSVLWTLLKWHPSWLMIWAIGAAVCTGISGLLYVMDGVRQLSASPASSPSTDRLKS